MLADPSRAVLAAVETELATHGRIALCHVVRAEGSTPGKVGWRLLVRPDGSALGNLGGGALEAMVQSEARQRLAGGDGRSSVERYYLTEQAVHGQPTGMVCGGMLEVFIEILAPAPLLVVCGAGPVGRALARAGDLAGFALLVADDRATLRDPAAFPAGTELATLAARRELVGAPGVDPDCRELAAVLAGHRGRFVAVAVVTRCWETDLAALVTVLGPPPGAAPAGVGYLGLMGSRRKVARIRRELAVAGYVLAGIALRAPIGLGVGGDSPGEIAIDVLAEILAVRHGRTIGPSAAAAGEPPSPAEAVAR